MNAITEKIIEIFDQRGNAQYGVEEVTQLQHALQCATLAEEENADIRLVVSALLHDIGHILSEEQIPDSVDDDLHDYHEEKGYHFLLDHFGARIADPVRLHVAAKRYLCTVEPDYLDKLSPTSRKSFFDQGGNMNEEELAAFEAEPHFTEAVQVRRWDDKGKDPEAKTKSIQEFAPQIEHCLTTTA